MILFRYFNYKTIQSAFTSLGSTLLISNSHLKKKNKNYSVQSENMKIRKDFARVLFDDVVQ